MKRKKLKPMFTKQELDAIKRKKKREKSRINFRCPLCADSITMFPGCKIKEIFCACGFPEHTKPVKMVRVNGFFCKYRFDLDNKRCDYCGVCDTGTDEDFDRYAVQVQNGDGYYDAAGTYQSYYKDLDEY
jgi:hypothetical protein